MIKIRHDVSFDEPAAATSAQFSVRSRMVALIQEVLI